VALLLGRLEPIFHPPPPPLCRCLFTSAPPIWSDSLGAICGRDRSRALCQYEARNVAQSSGRLYATQDIGPGAVLILKARFATVIVPMLAYVPTRAGIGPSASSSGNQLTNARIATPGGPRLRSFLVSTPTQISVCVIPAFVRYAPC